MPPKGRSEAVRRSGHVKAPQHSRFPAHRHQGRLLAPDRRPSRPGQGSLACLAGRGRRGLAWRKARPADRLFGVDRTRAGGAKTAARAAQARGKPGGGGGRADRFGAHLVGGAGPPRHRGRADFGDARRYRGAAPLSQRPFHHCQAVGMARGAGDQRERHRRHQRNPLRRQ